MARQMTLGLSMRGIGYRLTSSTIMGTDVEAGSA